jgi:hypothetical protein
VTDRTEQSIVINADARDIMSVIADFEQYPKWVSAAREVQVTVPGASGLAQQVRFVLDAGVLKDNYELSYDWSPDGTSVTWDLISSDLQTAQHGRYLLVQQAPGSTKVTYELSVNLSIPMIGQLKRRAEKAITDAALKELKKRVEG